ncbi:MAG TPA: response regulator, partial [Anaeromyxobacteraceae bacterium]|nr:response regulator [Anaeromyxobacteraceae bacterium]
MDTHRVLIVEPDHAFALSLASLFQGDGHATAVAHTAAEAELEIARRRPALVVIRAELPDVSGFTFCARLRHDRETARLSIVLYSSDTPPESLAEHARTPWAANGYLAMPLDTEALSTLTARLLAAEEPIELADDAVLEDIEVELVEEEPAAPGVRPSTGPGPSDSEEPEPEPEPDTPPPVPRRPRRNLVTDDDRLFASRVFASISERHEDLAGEALQKRPPPRRELLATPEGRLKVLREDLRWREAQIARLAEIWETRDRELAVFDERLHEKDVELQGLKLQVDDLLRRLADARDLFMEKEREHGASLEGLLLERFSQEKELIEVVAANERRIHELERDVRARDDDLARRKLALDAAAEELARLEKAARAEASRAEAREAELAEALARRGEELAAAER